MRPFPSVALLALSLVAFAPRAALAGEAVASEDALVAAAARLDASTVLLYVTRTAGAGLWNWEETPRTGHGIRADGDTQPGAQPVPHPAVRYYYPELKFGNQGGTCRGFFVGDGTSILTSADAIEGAAAVEVVTATGFVEAVVAGVDRDFGVALLKSSAHGPALEVDPAAELEPGRLLVIDGAADGGRGVDVRIVAERVGEGPRRGCARLARPVPAAAIGGPALGPDGRVRGIVAAGTSAQGADYVIDPKGNRLLARKATGSTFASSDQGMTWREVQEDLRAHPWKLLNFSGGTVSAGSDAATVVPGRRVARALKDLLATGHVRKSYLGLVLGVTSVDGKSVDERLVARVLPGAPAEGKILPGDRIVAVGERTLLPSDDVSYEILALEPGVATTLTVERAAVSGTLPARETVTPTERKEEAFRIDSRSFGFETVPLTPELRAWTGYSGEGLIVSSVVPGGVADRAGLKRGDRLVKFAGREIHATDDLFLAVEDALRAVAASQPVSAEVVREGAPQTLTLFAR